MKIRAVHIIVFTMALLMANMGVAHASLLLCQNKCDYALQNRADIPPCCQSKQRVHSQMQEDEHKLPFADCPHVNSGKKVYDTLSFLTGSTQLPSPAQYPAFSGLLPDITNALQVASRPGYHTRSGLSPPGIADYPPYYILHCSFLI